MDKEQARKKMNSLGERKMPFLFIIDFEMKNPIVLSLEELENEQILFSFNDKSNFSDKKTNKEVKFSPKSIDSKTYKKTFDKVKSEILRGNSYLVNLTCKTEVETNLSLHDVFMMSKAKYRLLYKDEFTFFSPEIFVQISDNKIFSYPMKGTIDANIPNAKNILLSDEKEIAEHYTIVDLIRNDLNIVAKNVKVDKFRYIDEIQTSNKKILQTSSVISGNLSENFQSRVGDLLFALLPAGSICGAPKKKTVEIILQTENYKRGYYTGVAGYFDGENLDSCVMIRFVENDDNKIYYKSGGGITSMSNFESEFSELKDKIYIPVK